MQKRVFRFIALLVAAVTLALSALIYRGDFRPLNTEQQKISAIFDYASADAPGDQSLREYLHPIPLQDEIVGKHRILTFTDSEIDDLMGYIRFRRGLLGGWQPLSAAYSSGPVVKTATVPGTGIRFVYAANCPPEVARYEIYASSESETPLINADVDAPDFFHVHHVEESILPRLLLFDASGTPLSHQDYLVSNPSVRSPGIGSAEINLVYIACGIVLLLGFLITRHLWTLHIENKTKETA